MIGTIVIEFLVMAVIVVIVVLFMVMVMVVVVVIVSVRYTGGNCGYCSCFDADDGFWW